MAFGSFFKKIVNGAQNLVRKAIPVVKKVAETVQKVAPAVSKFGENIGIPMISNIANTVGSVAGGVNKFLGKIENKNKLPPLIEERGRSPMLGVGGSGQRKITFDNPIYK